MKLSSLTFVIIATEGPLPFPFEIIVLCGNTFHPYMKCHDRQATLVATERVPFMQMEISSYSCGDVTAS